MNCELLFFDVNQRNAYFFFVLVQRLCLLANPSFTMHFVV